MARINGEYYWVGALLGFVLKQFFLVGLFVVIGNASSQSSPLDDLTFITEVYPPYQYVEDEQLKGSAVEFLDQILRHAPTVISAQETQIYPWARAYQIAQSEPNVVLFSMARTPDRENLFHWVGPIGQANIVLMGKKKHHFSLFTPNFPTALQYGAIRGDITETQLLDMGVAQDAITSVSSYTAMIRLAEIDRVDLIAYAEVSLRELLSERGLLEEYEVVYTLQSSDLWFGVSLGTGIRAINLLQRSVDHVLQHRADTN